MGSWPPSLDSPSQLPPGDGIHTSQPWLSETGDGGTGAASPQMEMSGLPPVTEPWGPLADIYTVVPGPLPLRLPVFGSCLVVARQSHGKRRVWSPEESSKVRN